MIVLDTHVLIWWVDDPSQLSRLAQTAIDEAVQAKSVYVSCISSWEIALLVERGRLKLALDVRDWLARCEAIPFLTFVPVNSPIAVESVRLPSLNQPCRVQEDGPMGCKLLFYGKKKPYV